MWLLLLGKNSILLLLLCLSLWEEEQIKWGEGTHGSKTDCSNGSSESISVWLGKKVGLKQVK